MSRSGSGTWTANSIASEDGGACRTQVGSIEGRVAVHHVEDALQGKNFTFKCHRDGNDIYSVNSIAFHPQCAAPCILSTPLARVSCCF